ncbi:chemotaxis protein CheD [Cereibacter changlensis JA139]|uniref:Probable chemoreceptor glutamine deamidase CheD n=3 Tax=Cereibacter changlensis TaxID=402884 RepID=A0A2T4JXV5_9RHOB|nr:chemotaxis protein CheD [Cereibacter changlensis JA139]PZX51752.1 chemotaxis protein CheD [Cereibacter changlensis]
MMQPRRTEAGGSRVVHVMQGGYEASALPGDMFTTILGSCVCTCLCDPEAGIGGINHFLLPDTGGSTSRQLHYGLHSMELLINALLKLGASKDRLQAKLFGGAMMNNRLGGIGRANAEFAQRFLENEAITCVSKSLGGTLARRIRYWPTSGRAQQLFLRADTPALIEQRAKPILKGASDDVTFF